MFGCVKGKISSWTDKRCKELDQGDMEQVIEAIEHLSPSTDQGNEVLEKEIGYFGKNKSRMRYNEFRRQGLFVGSGVVEAVCRTVIGQRLNSPECTGQFVGQIISFLYVVVSSVIVGNISGSIGVVLKRCYP